jgi:hypothetical protein
MIKLGTDKGDESNSPTDPFKYDELKELINTYRLTIKTLPLCFTLFI